MYCPRCGIANDDSCRICASCGSTLVRPERPKRPQVKPVSVGFYFGSVASAGSVAVALVMLSAWQLRENPLQVAYLLPLLFGEVALCYAAVVWLVLWHKAWQAVQDGMARTSAAKAIGFMFIPVFNLYWVFNAVWGLARDYNALIRRHRLAVDSLPEWLFMACSLSAVAGVVLAFVPYARYVFPLLAWAVWAAVTFYACRGINRLTRHPTVPD
jgi:hypothetical protein